MGVELGKVLAKNILAQLEKPEDVVGHDSSVRTDSLFERGLG
jgi:glucose-6-phosphate isomerase